ncbi:MAG TPA: hypothetical protein VMX75_07785 [Spirochaetia bacterium]|nr:hypothetical protein [Spirochaetia bacterium]
MHEELDVSEAGRISIAMSLELLWQIVEMKEELLITIRGITPPTALAFLADVGDIRRFNTLQENERLSWSGANAEGKRREELVRTHQQSLREVDSDDPHSVVDSGY